MQISIKEWINKTIVVYLWNGVLFSHWKEWSTTQMNLENIMLSAGSQRQKAPYCMIPLVGNVQNRQIHRRRRQTGGFQDARWMLEGMGEWLLYMQGVFLWGFENILELGVHGLHDIENVLNATELYTLKWVILCYVIFTSTEK